MSLGLRMADGYTSTSAFSLRSKQGSLTLPTVEECMVQALYENKNEWTHEPPVG